ncbi:MAG: esterase [Muribaculaceae bacterium]|nr:esterase [Muribaculaceae bacterium]
MAARAQQALGDRPQAVSPQTNADNSVTFRLLAPEARSVQVAGDFLLPSGAEPVADMTRGDGGVWEFTSAPLPPELYSYAFIVDGTRITDPSNVYQLRDIATLTNVFLIPGGQGDYYKVSNVPHGSVAKVWYDSPALSTSRRMTVYTPPGYERSDCRYPVLYLLHGMGGDENSWSELGRATQILDNMIACGEAEPMIVVMTNGNPAMQGAPGETPEGFIVPQFDLPKTMDGSFEEHFPDVVAFMDANYRTIPDKAHRAVAGLSMGGFHAHHISKQYPDMFDYVGLFSGAIIPREGVSSPVYEDSDAKLARQFAQAPALYWIGIGRDDFLYEANRDLRAYLDAHGYPYVYHESPDGHIWKNLRIYLTQFLPLLFK